MKCSTHNIEACAVCAYCGRALCPECGTSTAGQRMACSAACAAALAKADIAVELIVNKSVQNARASAILCYLLGSIFLVSAGISALMMPEPFLILFLAVSGAGMAVGGVVYGRVAKKQVVPKST